MACLEWTCPALGCDYYVANNDYRTHYCPIHGQAMTRHFDEERFDSRDHDEEGSDDDE